MLEYTDTSGNVWSGAYNDPGYNDLKTDGYTGTVKWAFDSFNFTSITDYSTTKREYIEDSDASPVRFFNFFLTTDAEQTSQELRLDGETDNFTWVAGLYYLGLDIDDQQRLSIRSIQCWSAKPPGLWAACYNPYTSDLDSYSGFGQVEYPLTEELNLILGARYIVDEKDFEYTDYVVEFLNPDQKNFDATSNLGYEIVDGFYKDSRKDEEWSGRVQLDWTVNDDLLVYGGWNRGVRGGGYNAPIIPLSFSRPRLYR